MGKYKLDEFVDGKAPKRRYSLEEVSNMGQKSLDAEVAGYKKLNLANQEKQRKEQAALDNLPPSTPRQTLLASPANRYLQGWKDPISGGAQLAPKALESITSLGGYFPNQTSKYLAEEGKKVDAGIDAEADELAEARRVNRQTGIDGWRMTGNMTNPLTILAGIRNPLNAATKIGKGLQMAGMGGIGGLMQPLEDVEANPEFWLKKGGQGLLGAGGALILGPLINILGKKVSNYIGSRGVDKSPDAAKAETDKIIKSTLDEAEQTVEDIPPAQYNDLRNQVQDALINNKKLDTAALLRKQDFDAEGITPLRSWVTRDASQFGEESTLRGVKNTGEPIQQRFNAANDMLQKRFRDLSAGSRSRFDSGDIMQQSLKQQDELLRTGVADAYKVARADPSAKADVPLGRLATDYANVVDTYGDNIPKVIRDKFNRLGLDPSTVGNQKKVFTIEDANKLLTDINANDPGEINLPVMGASTATRKALKDTVMDLDANYGPFASATKKAQERFRLHDEVPALADAAVKGRVAPEDFVNRYIINGKVKDVRKLGSELSENFEVEKGKFINVKKLAKAQVSQYLRDAAFGQNATNDKIVSPDRLQRALNGFTDEKLAVFFTKNEIEALKRTARVSAFINTRPNNAPTNPSGTSYGIKNLGGMGKSARNLSTTAAIADSVLSPVADVRTANKALAAQIPTPQDKIPPKAKGLLDFLDAAVAQGTGLLSATPLR